MQELLYVAYIHIHMTIVDMQMITVADPGGLGGYSHSLVVFNIRLLL